MFKPIVYILLLYCWRIKVSSSLCYSDFCLSQNVLQPDSRYPCVLTPVNRTTECQNREFTNFDAEPPSGVSPGNFKLTAYVLEEKHPDGIDRTTAFNFSVTNINFSKLSTRYERLSGGKQSACRDIEIHENATNLEGKELFVSCPFSNITSEGISHSLEYEVSGRNYKYSRKLVFKVPIHSLIREDVIESYQPFVYVEKSKEYYLTLYIQPVPKEFNVTEYKVWLVSNETDEVVLTKNLFLTNENEHIHETFLVSQGRYYFKVAALYANCYDENTCKVSVSPIVEIDISSRLLLMIVCVIWIVPVTFVAYYAYKVWKLKDERRKFADQKKTDCLLVYSPTHAAHVNIMTELAMYLRSCNVNAMIDKLDIPETSHQDPGRWCDKAFNDAEVVVIATSPPQVTNVAPLIYTNVDNHAIRLLKENYPKRTKNGKRFQKRYLAIQFPYCGTDDIPEEARYFKRFNIPEQLEKLVKAVHDNEDIRYFGASCKKLVESINMVKAQGLPEEPSDPNAIQKIFALLPKSGTDEEGPSSSQECNDTEKSGGTVPFATNINDLRLGGENEEERKDEEREGESSKPASPNDQYSLLNELDL